MNEAVSERRPRVGKSLRYAGVCLALWLVWAGWSYIVATNVSGYEQARARELFQGAVDIFPKTSTKEVRFVRFRHFNKTFMWANHILVARFEGVDTRFVDDLRREHCAEAPTEFDLEMREKQSTEKWRRHVGAVLTIRESLVGRRNDFEYCPASYKQLPGNNHTETVIWLEKGGRTAILYGEFYSG